MTKNKFKYNDELETMLIMMDDDEFIEWLETNEIIYNNPNLLEVMLEGKKLDEDKKE